MDENEFRSLLTRANTFKSLGDVIGYYTGYIRGLRRHYHGTNFGTEEEHAKWMAIIYDETRIDMGRGYRDGFKGRIPKNE